MNFIYSEPIKANKGRTINLANMPVTTRIVVPMMKKARMYIIMASNKFNMYFKFSILFLYKRISPKPQALVTVSMPGAEVLVLFDFLNELIGLALDVADASHGDIAGIHLVLA
jgi:hypothetical protein